MVRNTQVAADHGAPPVTQILARFVAEHSSVIGSDKDEGADRRGVEDRRCRRCARVDRARAALMSRLR